MVKKIEENFQPTIYLEFIVYIGCVRKRLNSKVGKRKNLVVARLIGTRKIQNENNI